MRSSLHPALFAVVYYVVDKLVKFLWLSPSYQGAVLAVIPNIVQACLAATGDYYTWQLSEKIYGSGSSNAWTTVSLCFHVVSNSDRVVAWDDSAESMAMVLLH